MIFNLSNWFKYCSSSLYVSRLTNTSPAFPPFSFVKMIPLFVLVIESSLIPWSCSGFISATPSILAPPSYWIFEANLCKGFCKLEIKSFGFT